MTLHELITAAERDAASAEPRAIMAGGYARHAVAALGHHDWAGAEHYLLEAIRRAPVTYAPALQLVERCRGGAATSEAKAAASRANGKRGGSPRIRAWTVREVTERGHTEFSVPVDDGAEIIATLLPDNPEDEAVFEVRATWGFIGPRDGVDADLDTLAGRVAAALPRVGGWAYDAANGAVVQCYEEAAK